MSHLTEHLHDEPGDEQDLELALAATEPDPFTVEELASLLRVPEGLTDRTATRVEDELLRRSTITIVADLLGLGARTLHHLFASQEDTT